MIGSIFPDISDKLENTLQLNSQLDDSNTNLSLLNASIEQKSSTLSAVPFSKGIQFKDNNKKRTQKVRFFCFNNKKNQKKV